MPPAQWTRRVAMSLFLFSTFYVIVVTQPPPARLHVGAAVLNFMLFLVCIGMSVTVHEIGHALAAFAVGMFP
jgi:hypothetical protein